MINSRVIPASGPELSGGVITLSPKTRKMLVPVPSQRWPAVLRKIASPASQLAAYCRPRTFSAYEVDFTPASAPCSLRVHGAVTIDVDCAAASAGANMMIKVGGPNGASEPSG